VDVYRTEEEQLAALKRWWKKNGSSLLIGVGLAMAVIFGWQAWQNHQKNSGEAASELYFNLLEAVTQNDEGQTSTVMHLASQLQDEFGSQTYAQYAALLAAKQALLGNDLAAAEAQLRWAVEHSQPGESLYLVANLRLARVMVAKGGEDNLQAGLALIETVDAGSHQPTYDEVKGDIYLALGREDDARKAYQKAADALKERGENRLVLNMKLNDLAVAEH
jgi:predicted negative regulator of RcsB-dependent stress response